MTKDHAGRKILLLGTAQWGWTVEKKEAFHILDSWIGAGMRGVDCATNYPINKNPADFRAAEKMLHEYIRAHGLRDLSVTMKIGSLDNLRSPESNLAPSFVLMMGEEYHRLFGDNLYGLMFHWDNRSDAAGIRSSLEALARLQREADIQPGLSGIKWPEIYLEANESTGLTFDIQLKHNILQSDIGRYQVMCAPQKSDSGATGHRCFAYGINAGGLKLEEQYSRDSTLLARGGQPEKAAKMVGKIRELLPVWNTAFVRPPVKTMNHVGLIFAGLNPLLHGIVIGVSTRSQLQETLGFWQNTEVFDYSDVYEALQKIARSPSPEAGNY